MWTAVAVIAVIVSGFFGVVFGWALRRAQHARYEYHVETIGTTMENERLEVWLDFCGRLGWKLVAVEDGPNGRRAILVKEEILVREEAEVIPPHVG